MRSTRRRRMGGGLSVFEPASTAGSSEGLAMWIPPHPSRAGTEVPAPQPTATMYGFGVAAPRGPWHLNLRRLGGDGVGPPRSRSSASQQPAGDHEKRRAGLRQGVGMVPTPRLRSI